MRRQTSKQPIWGRSVEPLFKNIKIPSQSERKASNAVVPRRLTDSRTININSHRQKNRQLGPSSILEGKLNKILDNGAILAAEARGLEAQIQKADLQEYHLREKVQKELKSHGFQQLADLVEKYLDSYEERYRQKLRKQAEDLQQQKRKTKLTEIEVQKMGLLIERCEMKIAKLQECSESNLSQSPGQQPSLSQQNP